MKKLIYFCLCASLFLTYPMYFIEAATYEYDELGRVTQVTNEDGSCVTYVYDANGNLVEIKVTNAVEDMEDTIENSHNIDGKTDIGKDANDRTENNREQSGETDENRDILSDERIESETDAQNGTEEEMPEEDDSAKTVIDQVEEHIEQQNEAEDKNNIGKVIGGLLIASALGGITVFVAKKGKKENTDNE